MALSAGLHASAALALAATHVALGAGAAGDAGLDSLTLAAAPPMQVTLVTPADLLPATPPPAMAAPPAPLAPPAPDSAPMPPVLAETAPVAPAAPTPPLPDRAEAPPQPDTPPAKATLPLMAQAPGAGLPPPPAKPKPAPKPQTVSRSPAEPDPDPQPQKPAPKAEKTASKEAPKAPAKSAPAPASKAAGTGGGTTAGDSGAAKDAGPSKAEIADLKSAWGAKVRSRIEAQKSYPAGADGAAGTVKVRLTVSRKGKLIDVSVTASSGHAALDKAAVKAVRSAKFPPAPKGLTDDSYSFTLPMRFAP